MADSLDHEEEVEAPEEEAPQAKQKPGRAIQLTAPGVMGSHDLPHGDVSLSTGDVVGGRFEVQRYLGSSGGLVISARTSRAATRSY